MNSRPLIAVAALLVAGCHAAGAPRPQSATASMGPQAATVAVTKVLTIVEENHGQVSALSGMPYLAGLARSYGRTTGYRTLTHPSLPNYLAMAGGSTFGVRDDMGPAQHPLAGPSVFDVAVASRRTAKTYAEGMTHPCQAASAGRYAVKHNPWAYFRDSASRVRCQSLDVPSGTTTAGALRQDIVRGTLPTVGLLVPDLCHDAHDCSLGTADSWLQGWLRLLVSGPDWRAGRLAVVVTFDEVEGTGSGAVLTVVVTPRVRGRVVGAALSHLSWSRWMTDLSGARPLRGAGGATSLGRAFGISLSG